MPDGRNGITLPSRPSDVALPPYARRLDVRATRAAFAAGTLSTVRDDATGEDVQRNIEVRNADGYDPDVMHGYSGEATAFPSDWVTSADGRRFTVPNGSPPLRLEVREGRAALTWDELNHEVLRQSRLRRWQTIR